MKQINLPEVAVFLHLNLSRMGDKRGVSSEDIEVDADKDLVKVRKVIFKSAAFDAIKSLDSEIRRYARAQCFPYDQGLHIAPLKAVPFIIQQLEEYREKRLILVDMFAEIFPSLAETFRDHLRALHNGRDYDFDDIPSRFAMGWEFFMITTPTSLETVSSELMKQERNKMQNKWNEALEDARMLLRETCLNLVTHLRVSLQPDNFGAPKRLATSTVRNLQEFFERFNMRDITNDRELGTIVEQGKRLLKGVDAEGIREMDGLRMRIGSELMVIEEAINSTMIVEPTRRIKVRS